MEKEDRTDKLLMSLTLILVGLGQVFVYSSSAALAMERFESSSFFLERQVIRTVVGIAFLLIVRRIDYRFWLRNSKVALSFGLLALFALCIYKFFVGGEINGASRWIRVSSWGSFQPSEFIKIILVIYTADVLVRRRRYMGHFFKGLLPYLIVVTFALGLIVIQPNLGTAVAIGIVVSILLFVGGARLSHLLGVGLVILPVLYLLIFQVDYRRDRMQAFLNITHDTKGVSYQIDQSLLGLGSGGIFGQGFGNSKQKLLFLPEPHTDFVFSVVGEELGLVGTMFVLCLFGVFVIKGIRIARNALDLEGFLLAVGITAVVGVYAAINMGVVTNLLPTTGLPLPFVSYGGSSLISMMIGTGILLNIYRQSHSVEDMRMDLRKSGPRWW